MTKLKDQILRLVRDDSSKKAAFFAGQLARAAPAEKECILAGIDFERWLAEVCE